MKAGMCAMLLLCPMLLLSQQWQQDFAVALEQAKKEEKPILLVFAGSDWCGPCKKLDRDVWQSDTFKEYAAQYYVLYKADFPRKKKNQLPQEIVATNTALAERYNPKGHFPLVVLLDEKSEVYGKVGYRKGTPQDYLDLLNSYLQ